jgi:hypothetical protein
MTRSGVLLPDQGLGREVNGALRDDLHDLTGEAHVLEQQLLHRSDLAAIRGGHPGLIDGGKDPDRRVRPDHPGLGRCSATRPGLLATQGWSQAGWTVITPTTDSSR